MSAPCPQSEAIVAKVTVYGWRTYDIVSDSARTSRRYGALEAIKSWRGEPIEGSAVEVDASAVETDEPGMTAIGFDPHAFSRGPRGMGG
jgi:hypothetical protein